MEATYQTNAKKAITDICEWMDKHNETPKTSHKNAKIKKMAYKLGNLRQAKQGHIPKTVFLRSYDLLATKLGYKGLFNPDFIFPR
jgi:hypothetical protein